ncbi:carboxylesterase family protein [Corynebacterium sp. Q4381]|uniref:carboxylesterase family protein n=1 Tax=Corynebacterium sp. Marseille-Q4381 TaxID=3121597 RepID=UPI002FE54827
MLLADALPHLTTPHGARPGDDFPVVAWLGEGGPDPVSAASAGLVHARVAYRSGLTGWLQFPADAPSHYRAVADCSASLVWLQRNVEAFGGDPTNITVVGSGEAAAIALWLTRRDHYRGDFRRAAAIAPAFPRRGLQSRKWIIRGALGIPLTESAVDDLAARKPEKFARAERRLALLSPATTPLGPFPFDAGELAAVPLLVAPGADERGASFAAALADEAPGPVTVEPLRVGDDLWRNPFLRGGS